MTIKNLPQLYALFVCSVTMLFLLLGTCICLNHVVDLAIPNYMYHRNLVKYESNYDYLKSVTDDLSSAVYVNESESLKAKFSALNRLSSDQLTAERIHRRTQYLENTRVNDLSSLISASAWTTIVLAFFLFHWRLFRKAK